MRRLMLVLALLAPLTAGAQITFERTYGGSDYEEGQSVAQTEDGGYVIVGYTQSYGQGERDFYLVRTDHYGDTLWTRTYGGSEYDEASAVALTEDGGYIIVGYTTSFGVNGREVYLVKTDASGDTLWTRLKGGWADDQGRSVIKTSDGGYVIAGFTDSYGAGQTDVYLVKTDNLGHTVWERTYGGASDDYGRSVLQTSDGGYVIGGSTGSYGAGSFDFYLVKTNAGGDTLWTRTYGGLDGDWGSSVALTEDGGYLVTGQTFSFGAGNNDMYLVKTDGLGDTLWTRTYGGSDYDLGASSLQTGDGGYIITGYTESFGAGASDVALIEADSLGNTIWNRTFGDSIDDRGWSVALASDGGYVVGGSTRSFGAGEYDFYLIKTDDEGRVWENLPPDLFDQADTTVAANEYLTFTLEAIDPDLDSTWFSSPDLPTGATLDPLSGLFEWTPTSGQLGLHTVTFVVIDNGSPAMADTEQTAITVTEAIGVSGDEDELRHVTRYLAQNRPNPFGSSTTICYSVKSRARVLVSVYDIRGALVRRLVDDAVPAGVHRVTWDGRDGRGKGVGSGVYFCRLQAGEFAETKRMVLLR